MISFFVLSCLQLAVSWVLWNLLDSFGIFWNLMKSFEFLWNLLESAVFIPYIIKIYADHGTCPFLHQSFTYLKFHFDLHFYDHSFKFLHELDTDKMNWGIYLSMLETRSIADTFLHFSFDSEVETLEVFR